MPLPNLDLGDSPVGTPPTRAQKEQMQHSIGMGTALYDDFSRFAPNFKMPLGTMPLVGNEWRWSTPSGNAPTIVDNALVGTAPNELYYFGNDAGEDIHEVLFDIEYATPSSTGIANGGPTLAFAPTQLLDTDGSGIFLPAGMLHIQTKSSGILFGFSRVYGAYFDGCGAMGEPANANGIVAFAGAGAAISVGQRHTLSVAFEGDACIISCFGKSHTYLYANAKEVLLLTGIPTAGDYYTLDGVKYTWRSTFTPATAITSIASNSTTITVTSTGHGRTIGDRIWPTGTTGAGSAIYNANGFYIATVPDANTFTIASTLNPGAATGGTFVVGNEVKIAVSATLSAQNAALATYLGGTAGNQYSAGTTAHPTVLGTYNPTVVAMDVQALYAGPNGNTLTISENGSATSLSNGTGFLAGGEYKPIAACRGAGEIRHWWFEAAAGVGAAQVYTKLYSVRINDKRLRSAECSGGILAALNSYGSVTLPNSYLMVGGAPAAGINNNAGLVTAKNIQTGSRFIQSLGVGNNAAATTHGYGVQTADVSSAPGTTTIGGGTTNTDTSVTMNATTLFVGQSISGTGIPAGTYITATNGTTTATLSQAATATATGLTFTLSTFVLARGFSNYGLSTAGDYERFDILLNFINANPKVLKLQVNAFNIVVFTSGAITFQGLAVLTVWRTKRNSSPLMRVFTSLSYGTAIERNFATSSNERYLDMYLSTVSAGDVVILDTAGLSSFI